MDGSSQTSFIPKRPISPSPISYENRGVSIVTIVCVILFFGAVALSVGSYLYKGILTKQLATKKADLEKAKKSFDLETIQALKRLDIRMQSAETLLQSHIAFSSYFSLLEDSTLKSVRYTSLSIQDTKDSGSAGAVTEARPLNFKLVGVAKGYSGVALQSDLFTRIRSKGVLEPVFSGLQLNDKGQVGFTAEALIDRKALQYSSTLGAQSSGTIPASTQPTGSTPTATTSSQTPTR